MTPYLPQDPGATIVDVGAGDGSFGEFLENRYTNTYGLDGNPRNLGILGGCFTHAVHYRIPDVLPFDTDSVHFVHTSHLIEHLSPEDLVFFLKEVDRVLKNGCLLVVSAPMLWEGFYENLTHVKPYHPGAILRYMSTPHQKHTSQVVSHGYIVEKLMFRYHKKDLFSDVGADRYFVSALIQILRLGLKKLGICRYRKNAFTLILRKSSGVPTK